MKKLSAIIITRNEEDQIKECIKNISFADEIIVIDNGSTDQTREIAKSFKASVYTISLLDFGYLRNVGKEKAKGEWLFYIDADERVTPELKKEILDVVKKSSTDACLIIRNNFFFGKPWPHSDKMTRLMKKSALIGWQGALHETPMVSGIIQKLHNPLLHYTHNDIPSMLNKTNEWSEIEAQLRYKNNHPPMTVLRFFRIMSTAFWGSYVTNDGWKAGTVGLIESMYQVFSSFVTYAKLWEKQNKHSIGLSHGVH